MANLWQKKSSRFINWFSLEMCGLHGFVCPVLFRHLFYKALGKLHIKILFIKLSTGWQQTRKEQVDLTVRKTAGLSIYLVSKDIYLNQHVIITKLSLLQDPDTAHTSQDKNLTLDDNIDLTNICYWNEYIISFIPSKGQETQSC